MEKKVIQGYRLSPQQKRLWLLQQLDENRPYLTQCAVRIEGQLDTSKLKAALQDVVDRHEILRTIFDFLPGMVFPLQVIVESNNLPINELDLSGLTTREQQAWVDTHFDRAGKLNLDVQKGSLAQISLLTLSAEKHVLLVTVPALYADLASLENLVLEIGHSYEACLSGEKLDEPPMQYPDLSEVLNELIESPDTEAGREYWRQMDFSTLLTSHLPFEQPDSDKSRFEMHSLTATIEPALVKKIEDLVTSHNTTVSAFMLACWQSLLWRLSGQSEIIVGVAYNGRTHEELTEAIGLFAKYLPIHGHLQGSIRFDQLLEQVDKSIRDVYDWQDYFTWQELSAATTDIAGLSYFPFGFDFADSPAAHSFAGVSFSIYRQQTSIDRFNVKLSAARSGDSLIARFHYNSSLFAQDYIKRLTGHFQHLLAGVCNSPQTRIGAIEILSDVERQQLLVEFNNTESDYPQDKRIHLLFEEQAERTPNNIAVAFRDQALTYAQLNACVNQLAHYLATVGVGPEIRVGVFLERSLEMVIGLLAVLKAGGAYVPLDRSYPRERLQFILEDVEPLVVLTQERLVSALPARAANIVCLDSYWKTISQESSANPVNKAKPENLAYMIYTSGSTGKPKGVMISHQGLLNYLFWCTKAYAVAEGAGALVHSTISFDLTVTSLFSPLLAGRTVFLLGDDEGIEALSISLHSENDLSLIKITPAHLEFLNETLPARAIAGKTRALIIGGEALRYESLCFWRTHAPSTMLINEYGPTEAVVGCCIYEVPFETPTAGPVPIGRPIINTQLYVLNPYLQPVPVGVPGELFIGGIGVARGYLNQPELTAERFVPNPFSAQAGARLYKTGDLARHLPDGNIVYLGRLDDQVKIRGFRIELGEIEAVLGQYAGVRETVVIVREDVPCDRRLVAYLVMAEASAPTVSELQNYLKERLPEYMVPSSFVVLKSLPLTHNGKVDRRQLPAPDRAKPEMEPSFVAARTELEEVVASLWVEVLGVDQVGIHDNFFELGGHSLLVAQVVSRVRETLQVELPLRSLFEVPTVAGLAERIEKLKMDGAEFQVSTIVPVSRTSHRMKLSSEGVLVAPEA